MERIEKKFTKNEGMFIIKITEIVKDNFSIKILKKNFIKRVSDDYFFTDDHDVYAIYSNKFKFEIAFTTEGSYEYASIEEYSFRGESNSKISIIDDIGIFELSLPQILKTISSIKEERLIKMNDFTFAVGRLKFIINDNNLESIFISKEILLNSY